MVGWGFVFSFSIGGVLRDREPRRRTYTRFEQITAVSNGAVNVTHPHSARAFFYGSVVCVGVVWWVGRWGAMDSVLCVWVCERR